MDNETFTLGVAPDGIKNRTDIRILICYMLDQHPDPLNKNDILTLVTRYGFANNLETAASIEHLILNEHILCNEKTDTLVLSPLGVRVVKDLSSRLPNTIRKKTHDVVIKLLDRRRSERENVFHYEPCGSGYRVTCTIGVYHINSYGEAVPTDDTGDTMTISCLLPTLAMVNTVRERFFDDPTTLYKTVMQQLTGEQALLDTDEKY